LFNINGNIEYGASAGSNVFYENVTNNLDSCPLIELHRGKLGSNTS